MSNYRGTELKQETGTNAKGFPIWRLRRNLTVLCFAVLVLVLWVPVPAQVPDRRVKEQPKSFSLNDKSQDQVERKALPQIDIQKLEAEDRARDKNPTHPTPFRFAVAAHVSYTLSNSGTWQTLADGRVWRLRIQTPGAKSHNLGITRFDMPDGAKLWIYDPAHTHTEGPFTSRNRNQRGGLWTPIIEGDEIVAEVFVPTGVSQPDIEITRVNQGYRGFGKTGLFGGNEGTCNNDVVCSPMADAWRNQIRAVAVYSINNDAGMAGCTGTLMNDVPVDGTPYFLSANHCLEDNGDPATVVLYWNFQAAVCGTHGPGSLANTQVGGATLRANNAASDFLLFQLSAAPDPTFNVFHAGWDATGGVPPSGVGIHHPSVDVKAISFWNTPAIATNPSASLLSDTPSSTGSHWRVNWNTGTTMPNGGVTEGGSSGSCIFEATHGRCIGQLHGGPSGCGAANEWDYYGRLSVSWVGGGTNTTRLSNWLDPGNTGTLAIDGDTHITTLDGVNYDFQAAGEFVSLRDPDGMEVQTRQAPVATTFFPGPDRHDELATCVSVNTAVAARVNGHRVTYEPNFSGVPDPSGLQLRVDGVLTTLGSTAIDLGSGGRIAKTAVAGAIEIDFPDKRILYVTPWFWADQGKWLLNVDLAQSQARATAMDGSAAGFPTGGVGGAIAAGSWLPGLPDGTSMGPMPGAMHQRYVDLYQTFADAWRVTDSTSLFDYVPGTSTDTFTMRSWPLESGPCVVPRTVPVEPTTEEIAQQTCRELKDPNARRNCVFDVRVTGAKGFATLYGLTQQVLTGVPFNPGPTTSTSGKWALFLDAGANFPHGTFSNNFKTGFSFNAGLEYMFNPHVSAEGIFGYHRFLTRFGGGSANLFQLSGNVKAYLVPPPNHLRPFINGGIGAYVSSSGTSHFGGNVGAGILYELTPRFGLQGSYNFHTVNTAGSGLRFSTVQGGVRFVF